MEHRWSIVAVTACIAVGSVALIGVMDAASHVLKSADIATPAGSPAGVVAGQHIPWDELSQATTPITPAMLSIPALGVRASVEDVGIGQSGNMAVPYEYENVGWYRYGAKPGDGGSVVVNGHLDNGWGLPAVFWKLDSLKEGDVIYVESAAGEVVAYEVAGKEVYSYDDTAPLQRIFVGNGQEQLVLITCDGRWDYGRESYDERLVVYAKRVVPADAAS